MAAPTVTLNPTLAKLLCRSIVLATMLITAGCGINNISIFEQAVNEAWIEVQSQYRRRAELVMDLMTEIEPLRANEPELFTALEAIETRVFEMHIAPDTLEDAEAFANFEQHQSPCHVFWPWSLTQPTACRRLLRLNSICLCATC